MELMGRPLTAAAPAGAATPWPMVNYSSGGLAIVWREASRCSEGVGVGYVMGIRRLGVC